MGSRGMDREPAWAVNLPSTDSWEEVALWWRWVGSVGGVGGKGIERAQVGTGEGRRGGHFCSLAEPKENKYSIRTTRQNEKGANKSGHNL